MTKTVALIPNLRCGLAEGPVWDDRQQVLYFVNISAGEVHRYDPAADALTTVTVGVPVGAAGLRQKDGLVLATANGFALLDAAGELTPLGDPEADKPGNRFNDGKPGPDGAFWAGTMAYAQTPGAGAFYRLAPDGQITRQLANVTLSNGLAWRLDAQLFYHIDTPARTVTAYDFAQGRGELGAGRVVIDIPADMGHPDGMTIDVEGKLWIAHFGGGCVRRWDPDTGDVLAEISLPASRVTCCAFGGPDFDTLYITTASDGMSPAQLAAEPLAGALFAVRPGVRGLPPYRFAG